VSIRRVYLDSNILGRLMDTRMRLRDAQALYELAHRPALALVCSKAVRDELEKASDTTQRLLLGIIASRFEQLPWQEVEISGVIGEGVVGLMPIGVGSLPVPLLSELRNVFDPRRARC
jgi:hypothetical protein